MTSSRWVGDAPAYPMFPARPSALTDGSPALNLTSFVSTNSPPQAADKLMLENMSKNLTDTDEYPATRQFCPLHPVVWRSVCQ
ncbi:hypothetical protein DFH07DRAFT_844339 [Mycena maculata]|uniref:Uncharacterized protein n=1 Tax=Mycena maculata TaxID=230809 RepID=A0AAD7I6A6_9AGAR|nr:hypothetical protein DFH07DRAFT_844339 [Mycena maculata]